MHRRFKRQDRQEAIDEAGHTARAPRSIGPDRRGHVIHDRNAGSQTANAAADTQIERRRIDQHQHIGACRGNRARSLPDAAEEARNAQKDLADAVQRDFLDREERSQPQPLHALTADTEEPDAAAEPRRKSSHQTGPEDVARLFARDDEDRGLALAIITHHRRPPVRARSCERR